MPSIFRASSFGRCVVTHFLAVSNFHGHRPAVYLNQYLFWGLMSIDLGALTQFSVHPSLPVPLTKNGPLRNLILCPTSIEQVGLIFNIVIFLILNLRQTRQSKKHKENKENRIKSFYYFCKDFVKLHGMAHHEDSFNDKGFSSRLNTINYEYVVRP